jgi:hypothetical protein
MADMTDNERMNYWWRRAKAEEENTKLVEKKLEKAIQFIDSLSDSGVDLGIFKIEADEILRDN